MKNNTINWRVSQLEANYDNLSTKIDQIRTNELPHIEQSMASMKTRINVLTTINVAAIVIALILAKYF